MLLTALTRLGVPAEQALYVGDMTVDVQTAHAAGTRVWIVATGSEPAEDVARAKPEALFSSLADLQMDLLAWIDRDRE